MANRVLSQEEIDSVFRNLRDGSSNDDARKKAIRYDFSRPDRIAKDQLRAIHLLHDNFTRSLASSLSAYLRAYVMVNLVSVEQLSFMEFSQCLPSPTCLVCLSLSPFDGNAVLELNPQLVFPILETLLGGTGRPVGSITREITEIEQSILDGLFRIILHDLQEAWQAVTEIDFKVDTHETEPQLLQILSPNEPVVAIGVEIRIGETSGMMNLGIPSLIIKMLRQRFDQQWTMRKAESTAADHTRILNLIKPSAFHLDARLSGPTMAVDDLLRLQIGDVVRFDYGLDRQLDLHVNGKLKYQGFVVSKGTKKAFQINALKTPD